MAEGYGEFIRRHRQASGYKRQNVFSKMTGISQATISRIEKEIQKPEVRTLKTLAPFLQSTTYIELLKVCDYWSEIELEEKEKEKSGPSIDLCDENTFDQYQLTIDGKEITYEDLRQLMDHRRIVDLSDEKTVNDYKVVVDGQEVNADEMKIITNYIRVSRPK